MPDDHGDDGSRAPVTTTVGLRTLNVSARSVFAVVAAIGFALVFRNVFERSTRIIGWFLAASVVAALVFPAVAALSRTIRRGLALVVVVVALLATLGLVLYAAIDDVRTELDHLQEVAPEAAQRLEESERWGEASRDFRLRERVESFVEQLPERLAGGETAEAIRSATTRGAAYFVAFILTLFMILHGPRLLRGGLRQIEPEERRARITKVLYRAYRRSWAYLVGTLAIAVVSGLYAYAWCRLADLPGATVLALFVALMSVIPFLGTMIGALPVVVLALGLDPSSSWAWVLLGAFAAWQVLEAAVMRSRLTRRSIAVGPAIIVIVAMLGIDLYGLGGALVGLALAVFAVTVLDELAPTDDSAVDLSVITG